MGFEDQMANLSWGFLSDSFVNKAYGDYTDKAGCVFFHSPDTAQAATL